MQTKIKKKGKVCARGNKSRNLVFVFNIILHISHRAKDESCQKSNWKIEALENPG